MKYLVTFGALLALVAERRIGTVTLSESVSFECTAAGSFADPADKSKFYYCVSIGNSYLPAHISCASDYSFDVQSDQCVLANVEKPKDGFSDSIEATQAPIRSDTTRKTTSAEPFMCPGLGSFPLNKQSYYFCVSDGAQGYVAIKLVCGAGTEYISDIGTCGIPGQVDPTTENPGNGDTTLEPEPFVCPGQGLHANPVDKRKFYFCLLDDESGYIPIELECGTGTQFISELGGCGIDELPETTTIPTNEFQCPGLGVYPNPEDKKSYYFCFSDGEGGYIPIILECGVDQEFDPEALECVNTETEVTTTTAKPVEPFKCTSEGVFPDLDDDTKFYYCVRNTDGSYRQILFNCGLDLVFDPEKKYCVPRTTTSASTTTTSTTITTTTPTASTTIPAVTTTTASSSTESKPETTTSSEVSSTVPATPPMPETTTATTTVSSTTESKPETTTSSEVSSTVTIPTPATATTTTVTTTTEAGTESTSTVTTSSPPIIDTTTPTTTTTTTMAPETTTTPAPFNCSRMGMFPDPTNNKYFYVCIFDGYGFISILMQCSDGLIFFPNLYRCAPPGTDPIPPRPPIVCKSVGNYPDPEDCHTYYYCYSDFDGGYLTVRKACPTGTYFNPEMETCVDASNGICQAESESDSQSEDRSEFRCAAPGVFSDPRSDQTFFICFTRDGKLQYEVKSCYGGSRFIASVGRCVYEGSYHW